eukprot:8995602-Pyramimonas_sp.AAC.1
MLGVYNKHVLSGGLDEQQLLRGAAGELPEGSGGVLQHPLHVRQRRLPQSLGRRARAQHRQLMAARSSTTPQHLRVGGANRPPAPKEGAT